MERKNLEKGEGRERRNKGMGKDVGRGEMRKEKRTRGEEGK